MTFVDHAKSEGGHANLSDSSIVQDLVPDVLKMDALSYMSLEEEVTTLEESSMETVMVSLLKSSLDLHLGRAILIDHSD